MCGVSSVLLVFRRPFGQSVGGDLDLDFQLEDIDLEGLNLINQGLGIEGGGTQACGLIRSQVKGLVQLGLLLHQLTIEVIEEGFLLKLDTSSLVSGAFDEGLVIGPSRHQFDEFLHVCVNVYALCPLFDTTDLAHTCFYTTKRSMITYIIDKKKGVCSSPPSFYDGITKSSSSGSTSAPISSHISSHSASVIPVNRNSRSEADRCGHRFWI